MCLVTVDLCPGGGLGDDESSGKDTRISHIVVGACFIKPSEEGE